MPFIDPLGIELRGNTLESALAALSALEHAHQRGFVHRDVKPQNVLFAADDVVKLTDFGIAHAIRADAAETTSATPSAGTPAFMAPEQVSPTLGPVSPATDVWAVGATLYEMLAGRRPFSVCDDISAMLLQRVRANPPPLSEVARGIPPALSDIVAKALARTPAQRFDSAGQFAGELQDACNAVFGINDRHNLRDPRYRSRGDLRSLANSGLMQRARRVRNPHAADFR